MFFGSVSIKKHAPVKLGAYQERRFAAKEQFLCRKNIYWYARTRTQYVNS